MSNNTEYIPQFRMNQLADRVAMKVDHFSRLFKEDQMWEGIVELCQKIEAEPRDVNTIIIEAKKSNTLAVSGSSILWYHTKLTRIYILLYYQHNEDAIYKKIVFPQLVKNMGIYAGDNILKSKIQQEIMNIKEEDKLMEQEEIKSRAKNKSVEFLRPIAINENNDIAVLRKRFIKSINLNPSQIGSIDWADATIGFDKNVMIEIFWGIEDDQVVKECVDAIISTWDRLRAVNDNRCLLPESMALGSSNIDRLKFGGLFSDTIGKFYDDLWVKRNARNVYSSVETIKEADQNNDMLNNHHADCRTKELEAQIKKLKEEKLELMNSKEKTAIEEQLNEKIKRQEKEKEDMVIELLAHHFYNNEQDIKEFLSRIKESSDVEITELVFTWVKEHKISSRTYKRDLWRILHAAKFYSATESNWNTAFRNHP